MGDRQHGAVVDEPDVQRGEVAASRVGLEPTTVDEYRRIVEGRWVPTIGHHKVTDLRHGHVAAALGELRERGNRRGAKAGPLSERSLEQSYAVLKKAMSYAVKARLVARNVVDDVERPKPAHREQSCWDADQLRAFLDTTSSDREAAMWRTFAYTGMRASEVVGLRWDAVDLDGGVIVVNRRRVRAGGGAVDRPGAKSKRSRRSIDLDGGTVAILRAHRKAQLEVRLAAGEAYSDGSYVFADPLGAPLHPDLASQRFRAAVRRSGLARVRLHDLRHTHATLLLSVGVPVHVVSRRLGHASEAFTLFQYGHVLPQQASGAATAFANVVEGS